jgi:hypothetical protein
MMCCRCRVHIFEFCDDVYDDNSNPFFVAIVVIDAVAVVDTAHSLSSHGLGEDTTNSIVIRCALTSTKQNCEGFSGR